MAQIVMQHRSESSHVSVGHVKLLDLWNRSWTTLCLGRQPRLTDGMGLGPLSRLIGKNHTALWVHACLPCLDKTDKARESWRRIIGGKPLLSPPLSFSLFTSPSTSPFPIRSFDLHFSLLVVVLRCPSSVLPPSPVSF